MKMNISALSKKDWAKDLLFVKNCSNVRKCGKRNSKRLFIFVCDVDAGKFINVIRCRKNH
jgi:hypothetical protein